MTRTEERVVAEVVEVVVVMMMPMIAILTV